VDCIADVAAPVVPAVVDNCGTTLTPGAPVISGTAACGGTITYTYPFTDCAGVTQNWVYTFTVNPPTFTLPAAGSTTVDCIADVAAPVVPAVIDNCGTTLTPGAPVISGTAACGGTITYTYPFTDCAGVTQNWVYTFTVNPPTFTLPAAGSTTVDCIADVAAPVVPAVIDNCGTTLTPGAPVISGTAACGGTITYTYPFTDCAGVTQNWVYTFTVNPPTFTLPAAGSTTVDCIADVAAPVVPAVIDNCGTTLTPGAPVISGTAACGGTITYTYPFTDCAGVTQNWVYTFTVNPPTFTLPAAGSTTVDCIADVAAPVVPAVVDNCGTTLTPGAPVISGTAACGGTITYTYPFTDCAGVTQNWVYTFTVNPPTFTLPAAGSTTVDCIADVAAPVVPAVVDNCGTTLTPGAPVISGTAACGGTITYTYPFTDCAGVTQNWVYTFTVNPPTFTLPAAGSTTVDCIADVAAPVVPAVIDNCGTTLTPGAPVISGTAACGGTITYTYPFTDCAGVTQNWVYTFTVNPPTFTLPAADPLPWIVSLMLRLRLSLRLLITVVRRLRQVLQSLAAQRLAVEPSPIPIHLPIVLG
jgi:P2-related tail formation protein